jgi:hypothetical protein
MLSLLMLCCERCPVEPGGRVKQRFVHAYDNCRCCSCPVSCTFRCRLLLSDSCGALFVSLGHVFVSLCVTLVVAFSDIMTVWQCFGLGDPAADLLAVAHGHLEGVRKFLACRLAEVAPHTMGKIARAAKHTVDISLFGVCTVWAICVNGRTAVIGTLCASLLFRLP